MNVRFAVRNDDDTNAAEALSEERHEAIARPLRLRVCCFGRQPSFDRVSGMSGQASPVLTQPALYVQKPVPNGAAFLMGSSRYLPSFGRFRR